MRELISENIKNIVPYFPGKPIEELEREVGIKDSIKLASNENPLGPSPKAIEAVSSILKDAHRYPDGSCYYLKEALARKIGVRTSEIILGNGSNEIIEIVVRTFLLPEDEAIMAHPSFVVYSTIVQAAGGRSILVPLKKGRHDLETMASKITSSTKLVFIANPNNPTGTINTASEFGRFMERLPEDVIVVVDEAYHEYVTAKDYPDTLQYLKNGRNIIILRTFSKIYGLAGFRIGYGLTKESFVNYMNRVRQPFNTSSLAQRAALFALSDHGHVKESRRINEEGKRFLYKEFKSLCIDYIPTEANFIYIDLKMDSKKIYDRLLKKGVIVRPMGPTQLRITIGLPEENRRFIQTLKEILQKTGRL